MYKALIVEDYSPGRRRLIREFDKAWHVTAVACAAEALLAVQQDKPDLIVLDYGLPDMPGAQITRLLREAAPKATLVIYTGTDDSRAQVGAMHAGADDWFVKGQNNGELRQTIQAAQLRRCRRTGQTIAGLATGEWDLHNLAVDTGD